MMALLAQGVDVNTAQPDGATALHWAAHWNDVKTATRLIRAGARVNVPNDYGVTPLSLACGDATGAMVELLLAAGADPNLAWPSGETPLMTASRANNVGAVSALLDYGQEARTLLARCVDVNAKEHSHGQTALTWALSQNHTEVARSLIAAGADVQARSDTGFMPLMFAARQGDIEAVRMLLDLGADVNAAASKLVSRTSFRAQEPEAPAQITPG